MSVLMFTFSSCKQKNKTDKKPKTEVNNHKNDQNSTVVNKKLLDFCSLMKDKKNNFNQFEAKFSLKVENPKKNMSVNGTMRVQRDSAIWMSFSLMGIEGARALFTVDSAKLSVPVAKKYFKGDYSIVKDYLNVDVDYKSLQSLMINEFVILPNIDDNKISTYFDYKEDQQSKMIVSNKNYEEFFRFFYDIVVNNNDRVETINVGTLDNKVNTDVKYLNFKDFSDKIMPETIEITLKNNEEISKAIFKFNSYNFDKKLTFNLKIPASYSPLTK